MENIYLSEFFSDCTKLTGFLSLFFRNSKKSYYIFFQFSLLERFTKMNTSSVESYIIPSFYIFFAQ